jgi:hypothetical protein
MVVPLAVTGLQIMNRYFYPEPARQSNYVKVNFETEHSDIELPVLHITQNSDRSFHTFFVWVQRMGAVPHISRSFIDALHDGQIVVLVNPVKPFNEEEVKQTKQYLKRGGKILILHDPNRRDSEATNQLLLQSQTAMKVNMVAPGPVSIERTPLDTLRVKSTSAGVVEAGKPVLFARSRVPEEAELRDRTPFQRERLHVEAEQAMLAPGAPMGQVRPGNERQLQLGSIPQARQSNMSRLAMNIDTVSLRPILAFQHVEKGMVVVMASSSVFTDREMGYTTTKPNKTQSRIYELEYWIFEEVMGLMKVQ